MLNTNLLTPAHDLEIDALEKKLLKDLANKISDGLYVSLSKANNVMEFEGYFAQTFRNITAGLSRQLCQIDETMHEAIRAKQTPLNPKSSDLVVPENCPF
jgi:hypothetical protein